MVPRSKVSLSCLLALLVLGAIASTPACAAPSWKVNGAFLAEGQRVAANTNGGPWTMRIPAANIEIVCNKFTDTEVIIARHNDEVTITSAKECTQITPVHCVLPFDIIPKGVNWPTSLGGTPTLFTDTITGAGFEFELTGAECSVKGKYEVSGNLVGEWKNSTLGLVFPTTPLPGSTLRGASKEAILSGSDTFALVTKGNTLEVGELSGEWFVGGSKLPSGSKASLATTAQVDEAATLNLPKLKIKVKCSGKVLTGTKPEIIGTNSGKIEHLTFAECETTEPATGCTLEPAKRSIETQPISVVALAAVAGDRITFAPQTKTTFTEIPFNEGNKCALEGLEPVKGSATFKAPNGQTEAVVQTIEGLGSVENNSLEVGAGNKAFIEGSKALLRLTSGSKWSFQEI